MAGGFADSPRNGGLGDRPYSIIDWAGPASYTQLTPAAANSGLAPSGGQAINAASFGLAAPLEIILAGALSTSGNYYVYCVQLTSYNVGYGNATWALIWINATTGAQVAAGTNLSSENVRLVAFGPY